MIKERKREIFLTSEEEKRKDLKIIGESCKEELQKVSAFIKTLLINYKNQEIGPAELTTCLDRFSATLRLRREHVES